MNRISIPLSKKKSFFILIASVCFVLFGWLMVLNPEYFTSVFFRSLIMIKIVGISSIGFFGLCFVFIIKKLVDKRPGLIIDEYGIINNTTIASFGLIKWQEITRIAVGQVASTKFLILHTNNPFKFINMNKSFFEKRSVSMNYRIYGSPISIVSNSLKISFSDLEALIRVEFEKYKK